MKISDKAESADQPEVKLARQSAPGVYRLDTDELEPADDLTGEDQFPQYGDFLKVGHPTGGDNRFENHEEMYIECPADLARWLVEDEVEIGDHFRILDVWKDDGEWSYKCRMLEKPEEE